MPVIFSALFCTAGHRQPSNRLRSRQRLQLQIARLDARRRPQRPAAASLDDRPRLDLAADPRQAADDVMIHPRRRMLEPLGLRYPAAGRGRHTVPNASTAVMRNGSPSRRRTRRRPMIAGTNSPEARKSPVARKPEADHHLGRPRRRVQEGSHSLQGGLSRQLLGI